MAFNARQPPPPTVAEFAPQANQRIEDAPDEQAGSFGTGDAQCPPSDPNCDPSGLQKPELVSSQPTIDVPRVKRCVGDPPRQTEDPQSPPCVPYWEGDNGGATSLGVTRDEITIAIPFLFLEDNFAIPLLVDHFNLRYQFYGRRLKAELFTPRGNINANPDPATEQADAQDVESMPAFASTSTGFRGGSEHHYYDELARRGIISVAITPGSIMTESHFKEFAPYEWSVVPPIGLMLRQTGEFVCKVLAGKPPSYAGPDVTALFNTRKFGIIYQRTSDGAAPDIAQLRSTLAGCGQTEVSVAEDNPMVGDNTRSTQGTNTMLQMQEDDVTTVIYLGLSIDLRDVLMPAATGLGYHPEYAVTSFIANDLDNSFRQGTPEQVNSVIGVTFKNKWLPREDMPWWWAMQDAGGYVPGEGSYYHLAGKYSALLLLAAGIQMAGPNLTPQTFEKGLHEVKFPNPGAGSAPYYQGRVGFEGRTHSMIKDGSMFWYDQSSPSAAEPSTTGAVCYVGGGTRYGLGGWPNQNPQFYGPTCGNG